MSTKYPIYFDRVKMVMNPEDIRLQKKSDVSETRTFKGTVFQYWPDLPDILAFQGLVYGLKAYNELYYLQQHFEKEGKIVSMLYKEHEYQGFFSNFNVDADSNNAGRFKYSFDFTIAGPHFQSRDFAVGHTGTAAEQFSDIADEFKDLLAKLGIRI